jgi:hypothetical protein
MEIPSVVDYVNPALSTERRYLESIPSILTSDDGYLLDPSLCERIVHKRFGCYDSNAFIQIYKIKPTGGSPGAVCGGCAV